MKKYFAILLLAVLPMFGTAQTIKHNDSITIEQCNDSIKYYKNIYKVNNATFKKLYNEGTRRLVKEGKDSDYYYLQDERMRYNISAIKVHYPEIGIPMKEALHNATVAEDKIEYFKNLKTKL